MRIFKARPSFTLMELLFVLVIIGILIGMLMPATRSVRGAARRTQCLNNVRQIGLGVLNFEDSHGHFPACVGAEGISGADSENMSGLVTILPFVEGGDLFAELAGDANRPALWEAGYGPWESRNSLWMCSAMGDPQDGFAPTHYAFCIGDRARSVAAPEVLRGVFGGGLKASMGDVTDGSSNTILLGEIGRMLNGKSQGMGYAVNQPARFLEEPAMFLAATMRSGEVDESCLNSESSRGGLWAEGRSGAAQFNTILPPNCPSAVVGGEMGGDGFFSVASPHPGTVGVVFADGSCHSISMEVDCGDLTAATLTEEQMKQGAPTPYGVWGALGTIAGGEVADEY